MYISPVFSCPVTYIYIYIYIYIYVCVITCKVAQYVCTVKVDKLMWILENKDTCIHNPHTT